MSYYSQPTKESVRSFQVAPIWPELMQDSGIEIIERDTWTSPERKITEGKVLTVPQSLRVDPLRFTAWGEVLSPYKIQEIARNNKLPLLKEGQYDIEPGDVIGFHFNKVQKKEIKPGFVAFIPYGSIYYKRNGHEIYPMKGFVFCKKILLNDADGFHTNAHGLVTTMGKVYQKTRYTVAYAHPSIDLKAGETIIVPEQDGAAVTMEINGEEYVRIAHNQIYAKEVAHV